MSPIPALHPPAPPDRGERVGRFGSVADQRVEIVDHDPAWRDRFAEQRPVVEELLGPWLAGPVEHVGSTSVPGLRADLKERLARQHPDNRNAYSNAKGDIVVRALRRAGIEPPVRDALQE